MIENDREWSRINDRVHEQNCLGNTRKKRRIASFSPFFTDFHHLRNIWRRCWRCMNTWKFKTITIFSACEYIFTPLPDNFDVFRNKISTEAFPDCDQTCSLCRRFFLTGVRAPESWCQKDGDEGKHKKKGFLQSTKMFVLFSVRVPKNKSSYVTLMLWRLYERPPPRYEKERHENVARKNNFICTEHSWDCT